MSILTLDIRFYAITLAIFLTLLVVDVHRTMNIGLTIISTTLILHRTSLIIGFHPVIGFLEVDAIATLITQTPYDDGRMVDESLHITLVTLDMSLEVFRELGERFLIISHTMRFKVGLSSHIDSIFITEVIPARIIRIMTGTNSVDIQLLHNFNILNHALHADHIATIRIYFMTVSTLDQDRLAIDQKLCILDFHIAETYLLRNNLRYTLLIFQSNECLI